MVVCCVSILSVYCMVCTLSVMHMLLYLVISVFWSQPWLLSFCWCLMPSHVCIPHCPVRVPWSTTPDFSCCFICSQIVAVCQCYILVHGPLQFLLSFVAPLSQLWCGPLYTALTCGVCWESILKINRSVMVKYQVLFSLGGGGRRHSVVLVIVDKISAWWTQTAQLSSINHSS